MKKTMSLLLLVAVTSSVWADRENERDRGSRSSACMNIVQQNKELRNPADKTKTPQPVKVSNCEKLYLISVANNSEDMEPMPAKTTADKKYSCGQVAGYTVDYNDCIRVKNAYDAVIVAEQAMFVAQQVAVNENSIKQNKAVAQAQQNGDVQNASLKAIEETNRKHADMYKQQALVYTTAVAYMGSQMVLWQGKGKNGASKFCAKGAGRFATAKDELGIKDPSITCEALMAEAKDNDKVYANNDMKGKFAMAGAMFAKKALDAKRMAGLSETVANQVAAAPVMNDDPQVQLDKCVLIPAPPECERRGPNIKSPNSFKGSSVDFGSGSGANQAFNFNPDDTTVSGDDGVSNGTDPEKIADIASPFEKEAAAANEILDPASAATMGPGGGGAGGGMGGGGGGGGGGSASLGDDLAGAQADENSDPEIKTGKVDGKYKSGGKGGAGFQAVSKSKEDANPFASLFDSKGNGEGGIEEDRSIASGDIDGQASGLFQKISNRYGQVQKDNRVYQNLE